MKKSTLRLELTNPLQTAIIHTQAAQIMTSFAMTETLVMAENGAFYDEKQQYLFVPFRAITATVVGAYSWKATDFSKAEVLRSATDFLKNKPAFTNHSTGVESIIGVVAYSKWTESTAQTPAGIDILFKIDASQHPNLVQSLTAQPPEIQSCSITVDYDWSPSHPEDYTDKQGNFDYYEFFSDLGTIAADGKMVCRVVEQINEIYECSLVGFGADPYAKILDSEGKPFNPDKARIIALSKAGKEPFLFIKEENILSQEVFNQAIQEAYSKLRKTLSDWTKQKDKWEEELNLAQTLFAQEQKEKLSLVEQMQALKAENIQAKKAALKYEQMLESQKQEVIRLYKIAKGTEQQESYISLIEKADEEHLEVFAKEVGYELSQKLTGFCGHCGSREISFRSSQPLSLNPELSLETYEEDYKGKSMKL